MNEQHIKDHFGPVVIYVWDGTPDELQQRQQEALNSYNTLRTGDVLYFSAQKPVDDARATVWFDGREEAA
jgi:hypothetical protein